MAITTTAHPTDPYTDFSFVLLVDGKTLGGFSHATGLHRVTDVVDHRDGNAVTTAVRNLPGLGKFDTVSLKRGLVDAALLSHWHDRGRFGRQPATLALLDEHRRLAVVWHLSDAWVIQLAGASRSSDRDVVAVELLELAHEGLTLAD
jgi:phage tail-like protein